MQSSQLHCKKFDMLSRRVCKEYFVHYISLFKGVCVWGGGGGGGGGGRGAKIVSTSVISKDPNVDLYSKVTKSVFFFLNLV